MTRTGPARPVREAVYARDGYRCVICQDQEGPFSIHHRRPRSMGGSRRADTNSPANLLLLCDACHRSVESNRQDAKSKGWLLSQTAVPSACPVVWHGQTRTLNDNGSVS